MNLVDSHDVPRIHNYVNTGEAEIRMTLTGMLFWTGIPCIYYGDEAHIDGYVEHDSGFRYPMPTEPYSEVGRKIKEWYRRAIELRRMKRSFSEGSRKVLWKNEGQMVISRFFGKEAYVGILHNEEKKATISIPLSLIGKKTVISKDLLTGEELPLEVEKEACFVKIPGKGAWILACGAE
jgi:alpha-glucosidase